ncbi:MAG: primosomal protein N' [Chitinispirillia bacterium]|nr:primosomal protein N' [Chitinispirillia bacterium]MCL2268249.1 primosomal protein N' [Chitinispirillia bacterium]
MIHADSQYKNNASSAPYTGPVAAVAFPVAISGVYDYAIPPVFAGKVTVGLPVRVEVRKSKIWGVVLEVKGGSAFGELKEILEIKEGHWTDSNRSLLKLYEWMAKYYQCPMGRLFKPLVGKSIINKKAKTVTVYRYNCVDAGADGVDNANAGAAVPDNPLSLAQINAPATAAELKSRFGLTPSKIGTLCRKGVLIREQKTVHRDMDEFGVDVAGIDCVTLSAEQLACVERVAASFSAPGKPFLLYGITGSGKTHVYTELAKKALSAGRGVIILVPEISLTPQTILRFRAAIGDTVAVIHSRMSDGERRDSLQEIVTGRRRAVIGVRSALLVPMDDVGLIVVDEEHDGSYKQSDTDPRYNARDAAVVRAVMQGAAVVLGSATPSLESYYNAQTGKYHLLTLNERFGAARLPDVRVVDMTAEHKENNWTAISRYLVTRMGEELRDRHQIILLLNRRGFSTVLLCKSCGYSHTCPNCSVNLRFHKADTAMKCHLCGHEEPAPSTCPKCGGAKIKYQGTAIQKAEELLREKFPEARILRMDQDTTRRKGAHLSILEGFEKGEADILLGTQMVAKGLNFPNVTLVGVLQADTGLHFPDFRASERTFQLLTQVAGRAGRAELRGEVVIQTYCPNEPAVHFAMTHDYLSFYNYEIKNRQELSYPPFGKLARVVAEGADEAVISGFLHKCARMLISSDEKKVRVLGPAPAVLAKIDNVNRYSMLLKSPSPRALSEALMSIRKLAAADLPSAYRCIVDVDPVNML